MESISLYHPKLIEIEYIKSIRNGSFSDSDKTHFCFENINFKTKIVLLIYLESSNIYIDMIHKDIIDDLNYLGCEELIEKILLLDQKLLFKNGLISKSIFIYNQLKKYDFKCYFSDTLSFFELLKTDNIKFICNKIRISNNVSKSANSINCCGLLARFSNVNKLCSDIFKMIIKNFQEKVIFKPYIYNPILHAFTTFNDMISIELFKIFIDILNSNKEVNLKTYFVHYFNRLCENSYKSSKSLDMIKIMLDSEKMPVLIKKKHHYIISSSQMYDNIIGTSELYDILYDHPKTKYLFLNEKLYSSPVSDQKIEKMDKIDSDEDDSDEDDEDDSDEDEKDYDEYDDVDKYITPVITKSTKNGKYVKKLSKKRRSCIKKTAV
jgi:hypothetical protein